MAGGRAQAGVNVRIGGGDGVRARVWESESCWSRGGGTATVELDER
jgi:hypothetical protein